MNKLSAKGSEQPTILIQEAFTHNLKGVNVAIPKGKLTVITGLSGAGKSSLAFDTLFAEGQRMYLESLSTYLRLFLSKLKKPPVGAIKGLCPAIALKQKAPPNNPRSTVGSLTELYTYLRMLYARIGQTYSPVSGELVKRDTVTDVVNYLEQKPVGKRVSILAPLQQAAMQSLRQALQACHQQGFSRVIYNETLVRIADLLTQTLPNTADKTTWVVVGRTSLQEGMSAKLADFIQTAFAEGAGACAIQVEGEALRLFSDQFARDGLTFLSPSNNLFNCNTPHGACPTCKGLGDVLGIDPNKVIPHPKLSLMQGAVKPWQSNAMQVWQQAFIKATKGYPFPLHRPYEALSEKEKALLWTGNEEVKGINAFFDHLASKPYKMHYRIVAAAYRGKTLCHTCKGSRLRKEADYVQVGGVSFSSLTAFTIDTLCHHFHTLSLTDHERQATRYLLAEIQSRLQYLQQVGLGYLTPQRPTPTLSGGEYQRIQLATALGSTLADTLYVLDEPTIGLHPKDTQQLIDVLCRLRDAGNTVVVVEHDAQVMRAADQIIDMGPEAGEGGGNVVFQGDWQALTQATQGYTAQYLNHHKQIPIPAKRRRWHDALCLTHVHCRNIKDLSLTLPLKTLTVLTGVSGAGKSTLVREVLYPALLHYLEGNEKLGAPCELSFEGSSATIAQVILVDQTPLGRSSRSNPATYMGAHDHIRYLFAQQPLAQERRYTSSHFSTNTTLGCCPTCLGEGVEKVDMQFMADVVLPCETCEGKQFQEDILEVMYKGKNIGEILQFTVQEALTFFNDHAVIQKKLQPLAAVGMDYVRLGQATSTLSGGEAQRLRLATYLGKGDSLGKTLFIFDEPTTGLHFHDINKLLTTFQALIEQGHSLLVIEHNLDVIKCADWLIDLGPEAGADGGKIVFAGTPEDMIQKSKGHTANYLRELLITSSS